MIGVLTVCCLVACVCGRLAAASPSPAADMPPVHIIGAGHCTSFCLDNGGRPIFGTNMDHGTAQDGFLVVNKRHLLKTGWEQSGSGEYARWISRYGSVTLTLVSREMPWGGMNEAGLMISTMSLQETVDPVRPPSGDDRPPLMAPFFIQYLLDNCSNN